MRPLRTAFPVLGLTGGIAAGKSHVAARMAERGWTVLDADAVAREAVSPGSEGLAALREAFSAQVLGPDGSLDRAALARQVFGDPAARARLEALLHPRIEAILEARLEALPPDIRGAVLDAALWVETGQGHHFDALWVVEAPEALRLQRMMARDGLDDTAARARIRAQATGAEKALHADLRILNDGRDLQPLLDGAERKLLADWRTRRSRTWRAPMPAPFTPEQLHHLLAALLARGGDHAEVFVELRRAEALGLEDGRMEDLLASESFGVSLRLAEGEGTRFADLIAPDYGELLEAATLLATPGQGTPPDLPPMTRNVHPTPCRVEVDPATVALDDKVQRVRLADRTARAHAEALRPGALRQATVGYGDSTQRVWIATAQREDGAAGAWTCTLSEDLRVQGVLRVSVTVGQGEQLQTGYRPLGHSLGFEQFGNLAVERTAREAARLAVQALDARPAPAGTFPVILASSAGGTMIHEACGHGLEADLALAGMSAFAGKLGERVAAEGVTIIDDGTLPGHRGSSAVDDEGQPTRRVVLVENGILVGYLQSLKTARRTGTTPTGNGRRESYRHLPIPRMRNTFLAPGPETPEAILADLKQGLLVRQMGGGQVDTVTGNFVFQVTEGYWVEQGRIRYPVRNATLSGCGPEVLKQLVRIGHDLDHFDIGTCGKDGQRVPVSDAIPTILCPALVVGGTAESPESGEAQP